MGLVTKFTATLNCLFNELVTMHIIIIAWLYVMLMVSVSYWPDVVGMLWRFVLFGFIPALLWFKMVMFVVVDLMMTPDQRRHPTTVSLSTIRKKTLLVTKSTVSSTVDSTNTSLL